MITLWPEHTSLSFLFTQQKSIASQKNGSSPDSSQSETGEEIFHKLRQAIAQITTRETNQITTDTSLEELFPRSNRKEKLQELKKVSGYSIQLLRPKQWIYHFSAFLFLLSMIVLFINGLYGLIGILSTTGLFCIGHLTGIEFIYPTVGQVAEKITIDQLTSAS